MILYYSGIGHSYAQPEIMQRRPTIMLSFIDCYNPKNKKLGKRFKKVLKVRKRCGKKKCKSG